MMDFRQRLEQSRNKPASDDTPAEIDDHFSCIYYATERNKAPVCLDLRLPNGIRKAYPYSYFMEMNYDVENGIEIFTASKKVKIIGRNLSKLFDHLIMCRVKYIQANVGAYTTEDGVFVKEILIEALD